MHTSYNLVPTGVKNLNYARALEPQEWVGLIAYLSQAMIKVTLVYRPQTE